MDELVLLCVGSGLAGVVVGNIWGRLVSGMRKRARLAGNNRSGS